MVFILKEVNTGKELCLGFNGTYHIGRKHKDDIQIVINDKTVSKNHAVLYIQNGIATIKDLNSKRGTFLNKVKLARPTELRNGDVMVFGIQDSKFCFLDPKWETYIDINNFNTEKLKILQTLNALGVKYYEYFNADITHYTTNKVTFQCIKKKNILNCLIDRKPIVSSKFWYDTLEKSKLADEVPKLINYIPKVDKYLETQDVKNIDSNLARRFLFDDKLFIFFDVDMQDEYRQVINKCGGQIILYEKTKHFIAKLLCEKCVNYVLVKNDINIISVLEIQNLQRILKENEKTYCIVRPNDILINILKVSFDNFTNIKNLFSDSNSTYNKSIQTNEMVFGDGDNANDVEKVNYFSAYSQIQECEKKTNPASNNVCINISKSINIHPIKRNSKRLVLNPLQQVRQRNRDVIKSWRLNVININNQFTNKKENNKILCTKLRPEKHISVSIKNGNKRMMINPISATLTNKKSNEIMKCKSSDEDIEYWKKKYKKIEITEL
ncbi:hypothetical protein GWI33_005984 [Rhynchophorus ferrugineus]|uniref:FHA domain-containing protein n=1 Tax=Rhynchophorus ferrugineus TaxID=354439 RepID=A0A834J051_RHYFE|nr:hypothetical protein GWI33_005984 [Rhynchophorus ferrugineus]